MRRVVRSFAGLVLIFLLLCSCQGKPLPAGMDEETLLKNGREVTVLLAGGDYEGVLSRIRADVAAGVSAEDIQKLVITQTDGAGTYKQIDSVMTTGQYSNGEDYGVAVLYCGYTKKNVLFRLAFDGNYELIGMEIKKT